jgi:hypothetical protein
MRLPRGLQPTWALLAASTIGRGRNPAQLQRAALSRTRFLLNRTRFLNPGPRLSRIRHQLQGTSSRSPIRLPHRAPSTSRIQNHRRIQNRSRIRLSRRGPSTSRIRNRNPILCRNRTRLLNRGPRHNRIRKSVRLRLQGTSRRRRTRLSRRMLSPSPGLSRMPSRSLTQSTSRNPNRRSRTARLRTGT